MEKNNKIPQKPSSSSSGSSEDQQEYVEGPPYPSQNHPQNPSIEQYYSPYQEIDFAFSRLNLGPQNPPPTPRFPANFYPTASFHRPEQQSPYWPNQSARGFNNGGALRSHQNLNAGPGQIGGFNMRSPYLDPFMNMEMYHQDLYDDSSAADDNNYYDYDDSYLHGKKHDSKEVNNGGDYFTPLVSNSQPQNPQETIQKLLNMNVKLDDKGLSLAGIEEILLDVIDVLGELVKNQFGILVFRKLFLVCNGEQRTRIISTLARSTDRLVDICLNSKGSEAMQEVLGKVADPQQIQLLVHTLCPGTVALASDPNGQHIIQYCVRQLYWEYTENMVDMIADNCFQVGTNKNGCCVIQSCVDFHRGTARERLIRAIISNSVQLATDPYGNYVVQHLLTRLGTRRPELTAELLRLFKGYFVTLSCNKYASNVVEKFLTESGENHSSKVIIELLKSQQASMLLVDPYGNFVIQSALFSAKGNVRFALNNLIRANGMFMQNNLYGRKVLDCLKRGYVIRRRA